MRAVSDLANEMSVDLSAPDGDVTRVRLREVAPGTVGIPARVAQHIEGKSLLFRTFAAARRVVLAESLIVSGGKAIGNNQLSVASIAIDSSKPIAERLRVLDAPPGTQLVGEQVLKVLGSIRAAAEQVTGSGVTASQLLANTNFDGTGMTAEQLVREGRAGRILSRLDDLRFGARD